MTGEEPSELLPESWPAELTDFSRARLCRHDRIRVGDQEYESRQILDLIGGQLTEERRARLSEVAMKRTFHFVPVLENPYDLGNISAVLRSAEAFGFLEVDLVVPPGSRFKSANRVARGAEKWLDLHVYRSSGACVDQLHQRGFQVFATHLEAAEPIETFDFSRPTAVVLGNEKEGVSKETLARVDGRFLIPMQGFTQSFNISVAAALTFYHAWRERERKLGRSGDLSAKEQEVLLANYYLRCLDNPEGLLKKVAVSRRENPPD